MNRFRFRFANVLRYREILEETRKRDYGIALGHLKHEEDRLDSIETSIEEQCHNQERAGVGAVKVGRLKQTVQYIDKLDEDREAQTQHVDEARKKTEEKRTGLVEAMKDRKTLERLKDRDREDYDREMIREEQKTVDDLMSQRHTHPRE